MDGDGQAVQKRLQQLLLVHQSPTPSAWGSSAWGPCQLEVVFLPSPLWVMLWFWRPRVFILFELNYAFNVRTSLVYRRWINGCRGVSVFLCVVFCCFWYCLRVLIPEKYSCTSWVHCQWHRTNSTRLIHRCVWDVGGRFVLYLFVFVFMCENNLSASTMLIPQQIPLFVYAINWNLNLNWFKCIMTEL